MLPIVGRQADGWHGFGSVDQLARKSALVDEHALAAGRDPRSIVRSTQISISEPWREVGRVAAALAEAGFSYVVVSWPSEGRKRLEEFVEKVMPDIAAL